MSSFRKASKSAADESGAPRLEGVKPWLNGQNLVSSGNRELDDILGGGHALGTLCLLHEDIHSNYAETLLQYSIAESISQGHKTLIICRNTAEAEQLIAGLPFNMNKSKLSIGKTEGPSTAEDRKKHLKIAWQYGKYIKDKETPKGRGVGSFCSSYDLASRMQPDVLEANYPRVFAVYRDRSSSDSLFDSDSSCECQLTDACHKIIRVISAFKQAHSNSRTPLRVFIPRLFGAPNEHNLNVPSACPALRNFFYF